MNKYENNKIIEELLKNYLFIIDYIYNSKFYNELNIIYYLK